MKNIFKKVGKGLMALSILVNTFMPITLVNAEGEGTFAVTLTVASADTEQLSLAKSTSHEEEIIVNYTTPINNDNSSTIGGHIPQSNDGDLVSVTCTTTQCTYVVKNGKSINFNYHDGELDLKQGETVLDRNLNLFSGNANITISVKATNNQEQNQGNDPNNTPNVGGNFDGKAFLIWSCGTGTCFHYFDNIPSFDDGNSEFYKDTEVTADNDSSKHFDVKAQYKGWALKAKFENYENAYIAKNNIANVASIDWTKVNPATLVGDPPDMREWEDKAVKAGVCNKGTMAQDEFEDCVDQYYITQGNLPFVKLQPLGEPDYDNCYVSYGDRNFKVVVYTEDYKGISMANLSELNYYPASWNNPYLMVDQFDLSNSTKDKPTTLNSILLEKTVIIKARTEFNGFEISKIEALDVPLDAVDIQKVDGVFKLTFSSNFYDNVVFKVTDSNNEVSYMQIKRSTIDAWFRNQNDKSYLYADFFFDKEKSYEDFDITAKIIYKDGTVKKVKLTPYGRVDDGMDNWTEAPEVDESVSPNPSDPHIKTGKGLKRSAFVYELSQGEDRKISKIYMNAEYKGSTADVYAGAYVGSGQGTLANIYTGEEA